MNPTTSSMYFFSRSSDAATSLYFRIDDLDESKTTTVEGIGGVVFQYKGIALIVSNDYGGTLLSTKKDALNMEAFFSSLKNYVVKVKYNLSAKEFMNICKYLAVGVFYPEIYKRIVIYFAGHGGNGFITMQDGRKVVIDDIQCIFDDSRLGDTAKLIFIDACRGSTKDFGFRGSGDTVQDNRPNCASHGNMLIAYATLKHHVSCSFEDGGFWTNVLYRYLCEHKGEDLQWILTKICGSMASQKFLRKKGTKEYFYQTSHFDSSLRQPINFWMEAGQGSSKSDPFMITKLHLETTHLWRSITSTKWSNLEGPELHLDVAIIKSKRLRDRFHGTHAMGSVEDKISIEEILTNGHQKITLIEGDPGAGKTTVTINICKKWAEGKLLKGKLVFLVPLCNSYYHMVSNLNELLDKLGCSEIKEYAKESSGKDLVFILDGWDELPDHLQSQSYFHDIIFNRIALTCSSIIVTSRPACSGQISQVVQDRSYQILGLSFETVENYIETYFKDNPQSVRPLLDILNGKNYFHQHFYLPITIVIMCFVFHNNDNQLPETLSKLYEKFVLLCVRCNIPKDFKEKFKSWQNIPEELSHLFRKLCEIALNKLISKELVFSESEIENEIKQLPFTTNIDVFGLLSIHHGINELADMEIRYSFIHRAVQELLAAMSILETNSMEQIFNEHFHESSYLINVFPFVFGLMSKVDVKHLAQQLKLRFIESDRSGKLLTTILHCLFEAHDESLCHEFGKVFNEEHNINLKELRSDLEYHYAAYFLSVCSFEQLNVTINTLIDVNVEIMSQYLCNTSTGITSFNCEGLGLTEKGITVMEKFLICQRKLSSLIIRDILVVSPRSINIMRDTICKISKLNISITKVTLLNCYMSKADLDSLGSFVMTLKSLECLHIDCPLVEVFLNSSHSFSEALCSTLSLKEFKVGIYSDDDSKMISNVLSQSSSLKILHIDDVKNSDHLAIIFDGLLSNQTVKRFHACQSCVDSSTELSKSIENCIARNQSLTMIEISCTTDVKRKAMWPSSRVCSICTGLQSNNTLVTLNISRCYIDTEASDNMSLMLSQNTSLQHLFLNKVKMNKPEAVTIIRTCNTNTTLKVLSLLKWPVKDEKDKPFGEIFEFVFSTDTEIGDILDQVQNSRQDKNKPILEVIWKRSESEKLLNDIIQTY